MPVKQDTLTDPLFKLLGVLLLGAVSLFAGWVTTSITTHSNDITDLKVEDATFTSDLAVINDKVDLLLQIQGIEYNGPAFRHHNQSKQ